MIDTSEGLVGWVVVSEDGESGLFDDDDEDEDPQVGSLDKAK